MSKPEAAANAREDVIVVHSATEMPGEYRQRVTVRQYELAADHDGEGEDTAPSAHDYFDAALAACKTLTATWYAKRNEMPLERVEAHVERDDSQERKGRYGLKVRMTYHGDLSDEQRTRLHRAVERCPIHKLMTSTEVVIETEPLALPASETM